MTATIAKAVNGRKFIFRWNLKKMFADKMYVDERTRRSTGRWLTQFFLKKCVLDMCMFHVSQWSLSIVTIAFVLLSSFQTIWKEGGVRVCGDAVLRYFWCGFAVIFILTRGIAVSKH